MATTKHRTIFQNVAAGLTAAGISFFPVAASAQSASADPVGKAFQAFSQNACDAGRQYGASAKFDAPTQHAFDRAAILCDIRSATTIEDVAAKTGTLQLKKTALPDQEVCAFAREAQTKMESMVQGPADIAAAAAYQKSRLATCGPQTAGLQ